MGFVGLPAALAHVNLVEVALCSSRIGGMDRPEHGLWDLRRASRRGGRDRWPVGGELAGELRLLWIIDRVHSGYISLGRGAVLAGMDRWSFMRAMD